MFKKVFIVLFLPILLLYSFPASAVEKEERQWQDETIYYLMIDRFQNGDRENDFEVNNEDPYAYQGGDFQGIIDKLDYVKEMGFTTIALTPIFANEEGGYHGYWINDFNDVDKHFGTKETFKALVKEAHQREMKVMIDFVTSHVGPNHPWMNDPKKQGWLQHEITDKDVEGQLKSEWGDEIAFINFNNPEVKNYFIDIAKKWINETNIDGYRLDTVNHAPVAFWKAFSQAVKAEKENFYLLGDIQSEDSSVLVQYEQAGIDGWIDMPLNQPLRNAFAKPGESSQPVFETMAKNNQLFSKEPPMTAFFDHHKMERFTREMVENNEFPGARWKLGLTYLYTIPETPMVYYGTEIAIDGGEAPENRPLMNFRADKELIDFITKLGEVRQEHPALRRGTMEVLHENNGMTVYKRQYKDDTFVIAINNTEEDHKITLSADQLAENQELRALLGTDLVRSENGEYPMFIERDVAEIYKLEDKSSINYVFILITISVFLLFILFMYVVWKRGKNRVNNR